MKPKTVLTIITATCFWGAIALVVSVSMPIWKGVLVILLPFVGGFIQGLGENSEV